MPYASPLRNALGSEARRAISSAKVSRAYGGNPSLLFGKSSCSICAIALVTRPAASFAAQIFAFSRFAYSRQ